MLPVNHPIIQLISRRFLRGRKIGKKAVLSILISYTKKTNTNKRKGFCNTLTLCYSMLERTVPFEKRPSSYE